MKFNVDEFCIDDVLKQQMKQGGDKKKNKDDKDKDKKPKKKDKGKNKDNGEVYGSEEKMLNSMMKSVYKQMAFREARDYQIYGGVVPAINIEINL